MLEPPRTRVENQLTETEGSGMSQAKLASPKVASATHEPFTQPIKQRYTQRHDVKHIQQKKQRKQSNRKKIRKQNMSNRNTHTQRNTQNDESAGRLQIAGRVASNFVSTGGAHSLQVWPGPPLSPILQLLPHSSNRICCHRAGDQNFSFLLSLSSFSLL